MSAENLKQMNQCYFLGTKLKDLKVALHNFLCDTTKTGIFYFNDPQKAAERMMISLKIGDIIAKFCSITSLHVF